MGSVSKLVKFIMFVCLLQGAKDTLFAEVRETKWIEPINLLNLNTEEDDFAPAWNKYEHLLYFNSVNSGYSKFFTAKLLDSINFGNPELVKGELNQSRNNQSFITFASEDVAYISTFKQYDSRSFLNIFETMKKRKVWTKPFPADSLCSEAFSSHPTVSPDGTYMIFSSNRGTDNGDADLWMAFYQDNNSWGGLVNITELNSPGNEITPFLASNDTLYFASDGQEGPGGYDIFMSVRREGIWQRPVPLADLNTQFNESDFTILPDGTAIFASDRPGGKGKLDLYLTRSIPVQKKLAEQSDLELSISAQVPALRTMNELAYSYYSLVPYIFGDNYESLFKIKEDISPARIAESFDSIYYFMLPLITSRLKDYSNSKLFINVLQYTRNVEKFKNSMKIADDIRNFIGIYGKIDTNRLIIQTVNGDNSLTGMKKIPVIKLSSDEPAIFEPLQLGPTRVVLEPSLLEVSINARPGKMLKRWNSIFRANDFKPDTSWSGNKIPDQYNIDLKPYANKIKDSDSLIVNFVCEDTLNRKASKKMLLNIAHSDTKVFNKQKFANKHYEPYYFFIAEEPKIEENVFKTLSQKVIESSLLSINIKVQYFDSDSPICQINATTLLSELKNRINKTYVQYDLEKVELDNESKFSPDLAPYVIRVLIEK